MLPSPQGGDVNSVGSVICKKKFLFYQTKSCCEHR